MQISTSKAMALRFVLPTSLRGRYPIGAPTEICMAFALLTDDGSSLRRNGDPATAGGLPGADKRGIPRKDIGWRRVLKFAPSTFRMRSAASSLRMNTRCSRRLSLFSASKNFRREARPPRWR
jgi:hypothetical protein